MRVLPGRGHQFDRSGELAGEHDGDRIPLLSTPAAPCWVNTERRAAATIFCWALGTDCNRLRAT